MTKRPSKPVKRSPNARSDSADAFLPDPYGGSGRAPMRAGEQLAETLAEEFVASATSAEPVGEDVRNAVTTEELGGPFVQSDGRHEFAESVDETNPEEAPREPFPTANRSLG